MKVILLALALSGCALDGWDDVPGAPVTPVAAPAALAAWELEVASAVETWEIALATVGCEAPFALSDDGHAIFLVAPAAWSHGPTLAGIQFSDGPFDLRGWIEIRENTQRRDDVLLHELGHALGLLHSDITPSLMDHQVGQAIEPHDITAAACVLGCGECSQ